MANAIRNCGYRLCRCGKKINIEKDDFVHEKCSYFHKSCYKERSDLALVRSLWHDNISPTVVYSQLNKELNRLIQEVGVSSDFILFTLQYVISHGCKLRYPGGLKYYIDNQDIKNEYDKKHRKIVTADDFSGIIRDNPTDAPQFVVKKKQTGFGSILGGS